tara:strand:+ start:2378 stop:2599 length:222 start_codon:yes stop_codon:yes gene_type:complete
VIHLTKLEAYNLTALRGAIGGNMNKYQDYILERNESESPDFPSFEDWLDPDAPRRRAEERYAAMCERDEESIY